MSFPTNFGTSGKAGRPAKAKPVVLRAPEEQSGFEWASGSLNPEAIQRVQDNYIKTQQMPPGLAPKGITLPTPLEARRQRSISAGWRKPRGYA